MSIQTTIGKVVPDTVRQLWLLVAAWADWRRVLFNRIMITVLLIVGLSTGAYAYVDANNDGDVSGVVVDEEGEPVPDATVRIGSIDLKGVVIPDQVTTDENGEFTYDNQEMIEFRIVAYHENIGQSEIERHHRLYKGQQMNLEVTIKEDQEVDPDELEED